MVGTHEAEGGLPALELRIAPVMTGGVSLAVWMGGATFELYRAQAAEGVYGQIAARLNMSVAIDVITGTSAGGLNGVLLAAALSRDLPTTTFAELSGTWLDSGDFADLLRSPFASDPPSLLRGEFFRRQIKNVLDSWFTHEFVARADDAAPLRLQVTTTTLTGEREVFVDDFGASLDQVRHNAIFDFGPDELADADAAARMALAARCSSGFPAAFEPAFVPVGEKQPGLPDMASVASFRASRFAVDGGVLNNLPIGPALGIIFRQASVVPVRRVIAYVNPDPSPRTKAAADDPGLLPPLTSVLLSSLVTLPRSESVADHLRQIVTHNERVARQRGGRDNLVAAIGATGITTAATSLWPAFRDLRLEASVGSTSVRLPERARAMDLEPDAQPGVEPWARLESALRLAAEQAWLPDSRDAAVAGIGATWSLGLSPLEYASSLALEMLTAVDATIEPAVHEQVRTSVSWARLDIDAVRRLDDAYWDVQAAWVATRDDVRDAPAPWALAAYQQWPIVTDEMLEAAPDPIAARYRSARKAVADRLAMAWVVSRTEPVPLPEAFDGPDGVKHLLRQAAHQLGAALLRLSEVGLPGGDPVRDYLLLPVPADELEAVVRLLDLYVVVVAAGGLDTPREQIVELVQISAARPHPLDRRRRVAADKLGGVEAGHFGAFLKRSWRANDWMWGRLDGSARLFEVLLEPARLLAAFGGPGDPSGAAAATEWLEGLTGGPLSEDAAAEVVGLYADDQSVPRSLPAVASQLAVAEALDFLGPEFRAVAEAIEESRADGAAQSGSASVFVADVKARAALLDPAEPTEGRVEVARELLAKCKVGSESLPTEMSSDAGARVVTTGLAVGAALLAGKHGGLTGLRRFLAGLRLPTMALAAITRTSTAVGSAGSFVFGSALAASGVVAGGRLAGLGFPGWLVATAWLVLAIFTLTTVVVVGSWTSTLAVVAVGVATTALFSDQLLDLTDATATGVAAALVNNPDVVAGVTAGIIGTAALLLVLATARYVARRGWRHARPWAQLGFSFGFGAVAVLARQVSQAQLCSVFGATKDVTCRSNGENIAGLDRDGRLAETLQTFADNKVAVVVIALLVASTGIGVIRQSAYSVRRAVSDVWSGRLDRPEPLTSLSSTRKTLEWVVIVGPLAITVVHVVVQLVDFGQYIDLYAGGVLTAGLWVGGRRAAGTDRWGFSNEHAATGTVLGTILAFVAGVGIVGAWVLGKLPEDDRYVDAGLGEIAWRVLLIVVLVAIVEELLFRGVVWRSLSRLTDRALWVVLASSGLFGLWHLATAFEAADRAQGGWDAWTFAANLAGPAAAGLVLGWARLRSRSLWAPIILHAAVNSLLVIAIATQT